MQTVMTIVHKSFNESGSPGSMIVLTNPTVIPRKGDRIDMGFTPASVVTYVLWHFKETQTNITIVVD